MNTLLLLQNRAIKAAQEERWGDAQAMNLEILEQDPNNISALNRLGFAYLQTEDSQKAKKAYQTVLELDKTNAVAKKYLGILEKSKQKPMRLPKALKHSDFIDEPGKTKSVNLVRLADADTLESLSIGADCELKSTKSRLSVHSEGKYIGTLPDDLFSRLQPLVEAGATYTIKIQSLKQGIVRIFMREVDRAPGMEHIASFPNETLNLLALDHGEIVREDEDPVHVAEIGDDEDDAKILDNRDIDEALEEDEDEDYSDIDIEDVGDDDGEM